MSSSQWAASGRSYLFSVPEGWQACLCGARPAEDLSTAPAVVPASISISAVVPASISISAYSGACKHQHQRSGACKSLSELLQHHRLHTTHTACLHTHATVRTRCVHCLPCNTLPPLQHTASLAAHCAHCLPCSTLCTLPPLQHTASLAAHCAHCLPCSTLCTLPPLQHTVHTACLRLSDNNPNLRSQRVHPAALLSSCHGGRFAIAHTVHSNSTGINTLQPHHSPTAPLLRPNPRRIVRPSTGPS